MRNFISYYYGFDEFDCVKKNNDYIIFYRGDKYCLHRIDDLSVFFKKKHMVFKLEQIGCMHSIVKNQKNDIFTCIENVYYVLFKLNVEVVDKKVGIDEIIEFQRLVSQIYDVNTGVFQDWITMWSRKLNYIEYYLDRNMKLSEKVKILSIYYIGIGEEAIEYLNLCIAKYSLSFCKIPIVLSHDRISYSDTLYNLYDPLNMIFDSRIRDVAEYIKSLFFNKSITREAIEKILLKTDYSEVEYMLLVARVAFPTFFFDALEMLDDDGDDNYDIIDVVGGYEIPLEYEEMIDLLIKMINRIKKANLIGFA